MPHTRVLLPICPIQLGPLGRHPSEVAPAPKHPTINPESDWCHYEVTPALEKVTTYKCEPTVLAADSYSWQLKESALHFGVTAALADGLCVGI